MAKEATYAFGAELWMDRRVDLARNRRRMDGRVGFNGGPSLGRCGSLVRMDNISNWQEP